MEPTISVIVPIYNIDKYIGICIESILNQAYRNLEIILVDDGSTDRCAEICDLYAKKDARIRVIHKPNGGLVSARKAGLLASAGEYVGYVDGDDWIGPGFYQALLTALLASNADIAVAGFSRDLFSKSQPILNNVPSGVYDGAALENVFSHMISDGVFFRHGITTYLWNKLFRREILWEHQLAIDNRITIGEDAAVVYPALLSCRRVCITDNCAYHYRQREDSMLKQRGDFKKEAARLKILYECLSDRLSAYLDSFELKRQIDDFITATYIIRSGGCVPSPRAELKLFPFPEDIVGKQLVVFGAGTFGQHLMSRLREQKICDIVAWIDDDYWEYRRCCMDVDPIEWVSKLHFDNVLIANLDGDYAAQIKRRLRDHGVSESKVLTIRTTEQERKLAMEEYLLFADKGETI